MTDNDPASSTQNRQQVLSTSEVERLTESLRIAATQALAIQTIGGGVAETLKLAADSGFRPETRRWAQDYVDEISAEVSRLKTADESGARIRNSDEWKDFQALVEDSLPPLAVWLIDPSEILAAVASITISKAHAASATIDKLSSALSAAGQSLTGQTYLAELDARAKAEDRTATKWLIATSGLTVLAIATALWLLSGVDAGWDIFDAPEIDEHTRLAVLAPSITLGALAAWSGRRYSQLKAAGAAYRERHTRLKTLQAIATAEELSSASSGKTAEGTLVRNVLIRAMADPVPLGAKQSGPGISDTILEILDQSKNLDP